MSFKAFDLGGHAAVRKLWADYMTDVDAVVFVVDSNDAARHAEAREVRRLWTPPAQSALLGCGAPVTRLLLCCVLGAAQGGGAAGDGERADHGAL